MEKPLRGKQSQGQRVEARVQLATRLEGNSAREIDERGSLAGKRPPQPLFSAVGLAEFREAAIAPRFCLGIEGGVIAGGVFGREGPILVARGLRLVVARKDVVALRLAGGTVQSVGDAVQTPVGISLALAPKSRVVRHRLAGVESLAALEQRDGVRL